MPTPKKSKTTATEKHIVRFGKKKKTNKKTEEIDAEN